LKALKVQTAVLWLMAPFNVVSNNLDETFVSFFRASKLNFEAAGSSETMVNTHQTLQGQKTEDRNVSLIASSKRDVLFFPPRIRPKPVQQEK
jgi:flagellar basal body rod protein FlgB